MSFDLYFYKRKDEEISSAAIGNWLTANGCVRKGDFPQWLYGNEDTGVYFSFEIQEPDDDPEAIEMFEKFSDFENTQFTFNLNFVRPNFFALEAFPFVERFLTDLELFALNPQSRVDPDNPRKEKSHDYYSDWSRTNLRFSADHFDEFGLKYLPLEKSNDYWRYNFQKGELQNRLGDEYFVPTLILAKRAVTGDAITLSTWTQHIPNIFPPADYFVIIRKRKKLFRTVDETGIIARETLLLTFADYLEDYDFKDCKIIHPENAEKVGGIFNNVVFDFLLEGFFEPLEIENLTNAERSSQQKI